MKHCTVEHLNFTR